MPNINLKIGRKLNDQQKKEVVANLGKLIEIIPGKVEADLMIELADDVDLYLAGKRCEGIYMEVRMYLNAPFASKAAFTEAVFDYFASIGFDKNSIYLTMMGMENWGAGGAFK